jgi:hypothetical protein
LALNKFHSFVILIFQAVIVFQFSNLFIFVLNKLLNFILKSLSITSLLAVSLLLPLTSLDSACVSFHSLFQVDSLDFSALFFHVGVLSAFQGDV